MYAKIFSQIFDSSIVENPEARFTFMDLLVLADRDGVVDMTHEAIARRTNRPVEIIRQTILELESPDPRSRTPDSDGRRLQRLDDHRDWGWVIINYGHFRDTASEDQRRERTRERVNRHRAKIRDDMDLGKCNADVTPGNALKRKKRHTDTDTDTDTDTERPPYPQRGNGDDCPPPDLEPEPQSEYSADFDAFWKAYPRKVGKGGAWKAWQKIKNRPPLQRLIEAVKIQSTSDQWTKDGGQYIPHPATWLNQSRWDDEIAPANPITRFNGDRYE